MVKRDKALVEVDSDLDRAINEIVRATHAEVVDAIERETERVYRHAQKWWPVADQMSAVERERALAFWRTQSSGSAAPMPGDWRRATNRPGYSKSRLDWGMRLTDGMKRIEGFVSNDAPYAIYIKTQKIPESAGGSGGEQRRALLKKRSDENAEVKKARYIVKKVDSGEWTVDPAGDGSGLTEEAYRQAVALLVRSRNNRLTRPGDHAVTVLLRTPMKQAGADLIEELRDKLTQRVGEHLNGSL